MKTALALLLFAILTGVSAFAAEPAPRPVVVELYTSQGCNSCLAANTLAGKLAQKPGILVLSFPVTYWDMFGWKDTLASEDNTRRQKSYAAALHRGGVYTPQIIVDGWRDVPASRPENVFAALDRAAMKRDDGYDNGMAGPSEALHQDRAVVVAGTRVKTLPRTAWSVAVNLSASPDALRVAIDRAPERRRLDATIWLFRVQSGAKVKITGGENAGQTVAYRNVVTGIQNLGPWHGEARRIELPRPAGRIAAYDAVAVVVQQGGYGRVLGAAMQPASFH